MPRSQAAGHTRTVALIEKPVNPASPTAAELNAGVYISCNILDSDFTFGATDSDKIAEKAQCEVNNSNAFGSSNFQGGATVFRYFDDEDAPDTEGDDAAFQLFKVKGVDLWVYSRKTSKLSTETFAADDEIYLGARLQPDEPQAPSDLGGYIKYRSPWEIQEAWPFIQVAAAGGGA